VKLTRRLLSSALVLSAATILSAATASAEAAKTTSANIVLATTTSVQDTGLLDAILPLFKKQTNIDVKVIAVGSGQAMEMARRGDADALLVHSPEAEEAFIKDGFGLNRYLMMHNDFVFVGPAKDPAKIAALKTAADALKAIAEAKANFISRGDNSGTHTKEKKLWEKATIKPEGAWYMSAGAGMAETLRVANEKQAYTLCDRSTWLSQKDKVQMKVLFEGDPALLNKYSALELNPAKLPTIKVAEGKKWLKFLFQADTRKVIEGFGKEKYGQPLYILDPLPAKLP
jgi:tungstate transport system substrate-binding protein